MSLSQSQKEDTRGSKGYKKGEEGKKRTRGEWDSAARRGKLRIMSVESSALRRGERYVALMSGPRVVQHKEQYPKLAGL